MREMVSNRISQCCCSTANLGRFRVALHLPQSQQITSETVTAFEYIAMPLSPFLDDAKPAGRE